MKNIIGLGLVVTTFFVSASFAQQTYKTETLVGIGATLEKIPEGPVRVDALITNAPAERAGMEVGDLIYGVKSLPASAMVDIRNLQLPDIVDLIHGPLGVPVEITFERAGSQPITLSIVREKFDVDNGN
jgi:C-terminal processing protease CtpA/Prc